MKLLNYLDGVIAYNASYVPVQLAKEDLVRVKKLIDLATTSGGLEMMKKDGLYIGWTKDDFRTHQLAEPLNALIEAIYDYEQGKKDEAQDDFIMEIWTSLHTLRLKTLVHCL